MAKRSPRLQFTQEERASPELEAAIRKADQKMDKLEKAEAKIPQKKGKQRVVDEKTGQVTTRLSFAEKKPPSKLIHTAEAPVETVLHGVHREIRESGGDNSAVDAANTLTETAETGHQAGRSAYRSHKLRPYRSAAHAEAQADKANIHALGKEFDQQTGFSSNPYSRWQQKRAIKKEYAAAKAGNGAANTVKASETTAKAAKRAAEDTKKTTAFVAKHKKGFLIVGGIAAMILVIVSGFSSCSLMFQGVTSGITASTYPSADEDMRAAEQQYCAMEDELQEYLDTYENTHDYDEYHYDLDEIEHDPYVLISAITALMGREWAISEVGGILELLFEKQYILTETVETETRYHMEPKIGKCPARDPFTGEYLYDEYGWLIWEEYEYEEEVPYTYYICHVELENFKLSHVPVYIMSQEQLSLYAMYMGALGNRPDLFGESNYVNRYYETEYPVYEIPPEALADEQFAAMITEAEKYLGFPYVWGGSNPSTSFDCSGFVSYVCNNCGVGWNFGRLGASGLLNICTRVSPANVRPGDLVFFKGTYKTNGVSHVGIYVGENRMIHCGDVRPEGRK